VHSPGFAGSFAARGESGGGVLGHHEISFRARDTACINPHVQQETAGRLKESLNREIMNKGVPVQVFHIARPIADQITPS